MAWNVSHIETADDWHEVAKTRKNMREAMNSSLRRLPRRDFEEKIAWRPPRSPPPAWRWAELLGSTIPAFT